APPSYIRTVSHAERASAAERHADDWYGTASMVRPNCATAERIQPSGGLAPLCGGIAMETPDYLEGLRAKSPSQGGESLYDNTWHVVARFADQARLRSSIATKIGNPRLWHQLYWSCFLHDFGKAAGGFQRMLATDGKDRWKYRHEVGSLAFLGWLFPD